MKEIAGFEISFDTIIEDNELIKLFAVLLGIPIYQIWNWEWDEDPKTEVIVSLTYKLLEGSKGTLVTFLFNKIQTVSDLFELDAGLYFSKKLNCTTMVSDPSSADVFLKIYPDGVIDRCIEYKHEHKDGYSEKIIEKGVTYDKVKSNYYSNI